MAENIGLSRRVLLGLVVLLLTVVGQGQAQDGLELKLSVFSKQFDENQTAGQIDLGGTELNISQGAPVFVKLELTNTSTEPVNMFPSLNPATGLVKIYLVKSDGTSSELITRRWMIGDYYLARRDLLPGASITYTTFLYGRYAVPLAQAEMEYLEQGRMEYVFPQSGAYQLYARYVCPDPPLEAQSQRVNINVGPPVARWDELLEAGIVLHLEGQSSSNQESTERQERLAGIIEKGNKPLFAPWFKPIEDESTSALRRPAPPVESAVTQMLQAFAAFWHNGQLDEAVALLTDDFTYNDGLDRRAFRELLAEGERNLRATGDNPNIAIDEIQAKQNENKVEATFRLSMGQKDQPLLAEQIVHVTLIQENGSWLVQSWQRLKP